MYRAKTPPSENPKSEARNPKQYQNFKPKNRNPKRDFLEFYLF